MIYELREYVAVAGAMDRLERRFADHTLALLERHGIAVVGFWKDEGDPDRLLYLLSYENATQRDRVWTAFAADPEWSRIKGQSERDGPLVAQRTVRSLVRPSYWLWEIVRGPSGG